MKRCETYKMFPDIKSVYSNDGLMDVQDSPVSVVTYLTKQGNHNDLWFLKEAAWYVVFKYENCHIRAGPQCRPQFYWFYTWGWGKSSFEGITQVVEYFDTFSPSSPCPGHLHHQVQRWRAQRTILEQKHYFLNSKTEHHRKHQLIIFHQSIKFNKNISFFPVSLTPIWNRQFGPPFAHQLVQGHCHLFKLEMMLIRKNLWISFC